MTAAAEPLVVVYRATNVVNGKTYIGFTARGLPAREKQHRAMARQGLGHHLHAAIRKYGQEQFVFEVLGDFGDDEELAKAYEIEAIARYVPAYNISRGGDGEHVAIETRRKIGDANRGKRPSEETRRKQSKAHRGKKLSAEQRRKISESNKGKVISEETKAKMRGRPMPDAVREKIRLANIGKPVSLETRAKLRAANLGKKLSESARQKMSATKRGKPAHNKGVPLSAETKAKMRAAQLGKVRSEEARANMRAAQIVNKRPVKCVNDGRGFSSGKEAETFYGLHQAAVSRVLSGRIKSTKGLVFVRCGIEDVTEY